MKLMIASKIGPLTEINVQGSTHGVRIGQGAQVDFDLVVADRPRLTLGEALGPHTALFTPVVGTKDDGATIMDSGTRTAAPQDDKE